MPGTMLLARDTESTGRFFALRSSHTGSYIAFNFPVPWSEYKKSICHLDFCSYMCIKHFLNSNEIPSKKPIQLDTCYNGETEAG